ncbi:beta-N-acetylhexosaminidase [Phenylobacterium sp.]|uniref:beta-N-acetylhexosaminidase n=1 Tax=Phenylobacterium sp. TaxID=1871053 RepID=UPI002F91E613
MSACAAILGCSGPALTPEEAAFFREVQPWGFIVFGRNIQAPDQLRRLTDDLRATVGREDAPVLIDQEGGRVARLKPPHWPSYPAARTYGRLPADKRAPTARLGARLIAHDLAAVGVSVDCLPVLDLPEAGSHEVIGDRAYAETPGEVAALGRAAAEGLLEGGVLPVLKHMPGHGRARADSHRQLPVVDAGREELAARDFAPFRELADLPMAMTAHVVYASIDPERPATTSRRCFDEVIRGAIGFEGLVMSDDLAMEALSGPLSGRADAAFEAGCDVVLHGTGRMSEVRELAHGLRPLSGRAAERAEAALARLRLPQPFEAAAARASFEAALQGALA